MEREKEAGRRGDGRKKEKDRKGREGGGGDGYTGKKQRGRDSSRWGRGGRGRGASKQTLRSFIFLAIIFFREKNPRALFTPYLFLS